ncbi:MAG: choice-of-anchor B family protein [Flavobacteriales bacterium]|nr:choice-of-anchor B family protein [Flavobacteriales bacterium]
MKKLLFITMGLVTTLSIAQTNENLELLYQWSEDSLVGSSAYNNTYNEVWGFVMNNKEFAVIGSTAGTHIFDVTDAENSKEVQFIAGEDFGPAIIHRDYHDRNGYLYAVSDEGNSSLQIIDLKHLPDSAVVVYDSNELIETSHNIFIDETKNILYACNVRAPNLGWSSTSLALYDINEPSTPVHLMDYEVPGTGSGVHDMWVRNDTAILNNGYDGLFIVDFSDLNSPQLLGSLTEYPDKGYNHSGWPTSDLKTYVMADENWGYDMKVLDISNLSNIDVTTTFNPEIDANSIAHNQIIKGDLLYVSSYHDGLQVYNISEPENPTKVASFSTYALDDHDSYRGAWGVYPLLPSGTILVSDMQYGLFVLKPSIDLDIHQEIKQTNLSIYPNPAQNELKIGLPNKEKLSSVSVYDSTGSLILKNTTTIANNTLDISPLNSGIYILKVQGLTTSYQEKLIVK